MTNKYNSYRGYSLFDDVEDLALAEYNRARVMKNIMLDHSKDGVVNARGMQLLTGYMDRLPENRREGVYLKLEELLKQKEVV